MANFLFSSILTGNYTFNRYILPLKIKMKGHANFKDHSSRQKYYHEEGSYIWQGKEQEFYQNQLFVIHEEQLSIFKSSEDLLHKFNITKKITFPMHLKDVHQCHNDKYVLSLWIQSEDSFFTLYRILGPHKDYTITTNFKRTSPLLTSILDKEI